AAHEGPGHERQQLHDHAAAHEDAADRHDGERQVAGLRPVEAEEHADGLGAHGALAVEGGLADHGSRVAGRDALPDGRVDGTPERAAPSTRQGRFVVVTTSPSTGPGMPNAAAATRTPLAETNSASTASRLG